MSPHLDPRQLAVLASWFPGGHEVVRDLSWGLVDTVVLHLSTAQGDVVLKAGGPDDRHIGREIDGYAAARDPWSSRDLAPRLLHADREARLIVVSLEPGVLALGTAYADDPDVHRQAGAALAALHASGGVVSDDFEPRQHAYCRELLAARHRIGPEGVAWLTGWLDAYQPGPVRLVPTHGDFSPRNWLVDADGRLRVIDLGRFDLRPAASDLCRLHSRHWHDRPDLAAAFVQGYGEDPRTGGVWTSQRVREALGTATWALKVGDEPFELEGHRMIADLVAQDPPAG